MNLKFKYVIILTERNVCAKNHAEILLERMLGQIGRFFSDKAICNVHTIYISLLGTTCGSGGGTGIWPLGMGNEVLKNGNGIEIMPVDFQFFVPFKFVPNRKFHLICIFQNTYCWYV